MGGGEGTGKAVMDIDPKIIATGLAIILALGNYALYIRKTFRGDVRPHMFSWAIWSLLCGVSFAAQVSEDAGAGMWQTATMTAGTLLIAVIAFFKGERNYTRSDWVALSTALLAIPLWMATKNPLWSVILITAIDFVATWPTVRKSWHDPERESYVVFLLAAVVCGLGFSGIENLNLTTGLYQGTLVLLNLGLVALILSRRAFVERR